MQIFVDPVQRYAKMRAHTATHLLHAELANIFPQTKQAGSLVDEDYLRFDFYSDTALTDKQLQDIENNINEYIKNALPVTTQEMSYDDAIAAWAKAFFEDKYDDIVRVVKIWSSSWGNAEGSYTQDSSLRPPTACLTDSQRQAGSEWLVSIELCGGTHVSNTAHIGACTIISQESVASWTKRITALTWPKVSEELSNKSQELRGIAQALWVQEKQIGDKIISIQKEKEEIEEKKWQLEQNIAKNTITTITDKKDNYTVININKHPSLQSIPFKSLVQITKQLSWEFILTDTSWSFAIIGSWAKDFAQTHELRWGWSDTFIQGKDPKILTIL